MNLGKNMGIEDGGAEKVDTRVDHLLLIGEAASTSCEARETLWRIGEETQFVRSTEEYLRLRIHRSIRAYVKKKMEKDGTIKKPLPS